MRGDATDARLRTCASCGHLCDRAGEFHPHGFCVMKKGGVRDPWAELRRMVEPLGVVLADKPPLVRNLRVTDPQETADAAA